jgi:uncharacterized protein YwgA
MKELQRASVVLVLAESLRGHGSWAGETHVQKTAYFLQELLGVPTGFSFILYKHGPYSFDLSDTLTLMRANGYLELEPRYPYGASFKLGPSGKLLDRLFHISLGKYQTQITFIGAHLASKGVKELEKLATALYVTRESGSNARARAHRIHELKPHISTGDALAAVHELDHVVKSAQNEGLETLV